jgi:hypothetical protein
MTRRSSQRALAREIYREMVAKRAKQEATPTPDPSPLLASARGGGENNSRTARALTEKVRALYEHSAVPVAEIARLAGVTERTIYKYAARERWTPRYRWPAAHPRRWHADQGAAPDFVPVRGAGGRFIRRDDKGKPVATGLKATDPAAAALAAAACRREAARSRAAQLRAAAEKCDEARLRALETMNRTLAELNRYRAARAKVGQPKLRDDDRVAHLLVRSVEIATENLQRLLPR